MSSVRFEYASRIYAAGHRPAVDRLSLEIPDGELCVLVGPSGSGKSTALRMLAGLEPADGGKIFIGDRDVTDLAPKRRDIAMVFQSYALYPHMTVAQNLGFALRVKRMPREEVKRRVEEAAELLELTPYLKRRPRALSGGQRQRVAMGRAIVREPQVFCMDEPLSNLDAKLRVSTRTQIASLQRRLGVTMVYVTHDQVEAMTMGDRVAVLHEGVLQQVDRPLDLYDRPCNVFVAGFMGSPAMNLLPGKRVTDGVEVLGTVVPVSRALGAPGANGAVTAGVRPEGLQLAGHSEPGTIPVTVEFVEELGSDGFVYGTVDTGERITVRSPGRSHPSVGSQVGVRFEPAQLHVFDGESGERL
ncbi:MAG TPA: ABC transporter ATP-binding protein [Gaiellales bacterium]|nr:ABC transporter ATP-binding protein [Gaiellales bacterium]